MDTDATRQIMKSVVLQIGYLQLEDMQAVVDEARQSRQQWDALGALLDPTRYRDTMHDGTLEHADVQTEIAEHLLAIRVRVDRLNALSVAYKARKDGGS